MRKAERKTKGEKRVMRKQKRRLRKKDGRKGREQDRKRKRSKEEKVRDKWGERSGRGGGEEMKAEFRWREERKSKESERREI